MLEGLAANAESGEPGGLSPGSVDLGRANDKLRGAAGHDDKAGEEGQAKADKPARQPSLRKPAPPNLRRIENLNPGAKRAAELPLSAGPSGSVSATTSRR